MTEELKLEPDPIARPRITPTFSPTCRCETQTAQIRRSAAADRRLTLTILNQNGEVVRTLLDNGSFGRGNDTSGSDGRRVRRGGVAGQLQAPRRLGQLDRAIEFPRRTGSTRRLPELEVTRLRPRAISPDVTGAPTRLTIRYRASEPVNALLLVGTRREVKTALRRTRIDRLAAERAAGEARTAFGRRGRRGGNRSRPTGPFDVRVRYVDIAAEVIRARPGGRLLRPRLDRREAVLVAPGTPDRSARVRILRLRAPATPGRYPLVVEVSAAATQRRGDAQAVNGDRIFAIAGIALATAIPGSSPALADEESTIE